VRSGSVRLASTPLQINIELTGICNIDPPCVFCSGKNVGHNYRPMDAAYLDRYTAYLEACERINEDSFGEPLGHPQLVEIARRFAAGGRRFSLVTNGLLLTGEKARALAALGSTLGLHVSLNAASARTFHWLTGKSFDVVVENVSRFAELYRTMNGGASPDLTLTFIVMQVNRHEVPEFLRLAARLGTYALLAPLHDRPSTPIGRFGYDFVYEREILPYEELHAIGLEAQRLARSLDVSLHLQWDAGSDSALRGFSEAGVDIPCLIPWRYLHIQQHSQKVYACPYHKRPVGDVARQSLDEIWNGDTAMELRRALAARQIPAFCWNNSASCPLILRARNDGRAEPLTGDITMGESDHTQLEEGWHAVEELPDRVRWTSGRARFRIAAGGKSVLRLRCLTFRPDLRRDPTRGRLELDGRPIGRFRLACAGWHEFRFPLPARRSSVNGHPDVLTPSLVIENPWVPARTLRTSISEPIVGVPRVDVGSLDSRELGIVVQRIWTE
jgi:MoaA/NifB/PqqE/SkfB family radical SAM enzyme